MRPWILSSFLIFVVRVCRSDPTDHHHYRDAWFSRGAVDFWPLASVSKARANGSSSATEQFGEGCVWRRGPRPGKGRNSRTRRSPSPIATTTTTTSTTAAASTTVAPGYEQYQKSLLEVPWPHAEYGEASSDDLSSEWDSDVPEPPPNSKVNDGIVLLYYVILLLYFLIET